MKSLQCFALLLMLAVVVEASRRQASVYRSRRRSSSGSSSGGSSSGGSSTRRSSGAPSNVVSYPRSFYNRHLIWLYLSVSNNFRWSYDNASYYRYPKNDTEYCVQCVGAVNNKTCGDQNTICPQSSDCFQATYYADNVTQLIAKGCLYDPYGSEGCEEFVKNCTGYGLTDCQCKYCTEPYCNAPWNNVSVKTYSAGVLILGGILGYILA